MAVRISRYSGDLTTLIKLDKALIGVELDDADEHIWFVGREDGQIVCYCGVKILGDRVAYLSRAGVIRSHRGRGLQMRMIKIREAYARTKGAHSMLSYTVYGNWGSIKSLLVAGYRNYSPEYAWAGRSVHYWQKDLTK